ncbi:nucleoporin nsp1 [Stagonosporopsis vannaccii]|nr:nucleoporin nsp1 [Stagonosporopsis vannaccii]
MSGKRSNLFGQGRPEDPYNERDDPAEVPQRATAAQLAARKIKTLKPRRPAGASSGLSQSANFGGPQQSSGFSFGASAPIGGDNNGANTSGSMFGGAFGGSTTNSFPPAQPSSSNNTFTNNSFPAPSFGAGTQSNTFQPPAGGFDFSPASSTTNPFGGLNGNAPAANGSSTTFGGSIFSSQPASNPFGGSQQNNTSSSAGSTSMFGTTNGTSASTFNFGSASSAGAASSTPAPAAQPSFSFGANTTSTPAPVSQSPFNFGANTSSTPAPAAQSPFKFGANTSSTPAPAAQKPFSFGANTPASAVNFGDASSSAAPAPSTPAPASQPSFSFGATTSTPFGGASSSAAPAPSTPAPASQSLFNFGASTSTPTTQDVSSSAAPAPAPSTPAPASQPSFSFGANTTTPFAGASSSGAAAPSTPAPASQPSFSFGTTTSAAAAPSTSSFSFGANGSAVPASSSTTPFHFGTTSSPAPASVSTPAPASSLFNFGGATQNAAAGTPEPAAATTSTGLFSFGATTPKPAEAPVVQETPIQPSPAAATTSTGLFNFGATTPKPAEAPVVHETPFPQAPATEAPNPFASLVGSSSAAPNMFSVPKAQPPASPTPAKATDPKGPILNTAAAPQLPKIGKLNVPKDWVVEDIATPEDPEDLIDHILQLGLQLEAMNLKFREMLSNTSPVADWSAVSIWHHQQTRTLKTKIDNAKKQRAAVKGVTGFESALSKRKASEEVNEEVQESSKRSRPSGTSTSKPEELYNPQRNRETEHEPELERERKRTATATSNLFSNAISQGASPEKTVESPRAAAPGVSSMPSFSASAGPSAPKPSTTGFVPSFSASTGSSARTTTPAFGATNGTGASKPAAASTGFTPSFGAPKTSTPSTGFTPSFGAPKTTSSGGFTPSFSGSSSGGNTDFMAAFAKNAKTYEQLAAERKKKAKDADYDSDDETEEEWSARYDKEEAERLAKEKEAVASVSGFSLPASTNASGATTPAPVSEPAKEPAKDVASDKPAASTNPFASLAKSATSTTLFANLAKPAAEDKPAAATNLFANLAKPASGTSSPSLFRAASPAPSTTGGRSVFDTPSAAPSPSGNLFSHLSSGPSSTHQDDTDDEEDQEDRSQTDQAVGSTGSTSPKRRLDDSETDSDATASKKQATGGKGSLLSRMTRADDAESEAEKENDQSASVLSQTNGTSTPTNKPFAFFDFKGAGANTAPSKSAFAGDQTFKVGSPIKFGGAPATEKKNDGPVLQFQPATPSPAEFSTTPAKPPPSGNPFNFGGATGASLFAPNFGASAPSSVPSSVFNSRAGTPLSETETNKDSAAEDDEEGEKQEQVDLSQLTEEEKASTDVIFHIDLALAKQQVDQGDGTKKWENFARGPLWILKDKVTGKCFVRIRIPSGATPLNYQILPALRSTVAGSSKKMVQATRPGKDKGLTPVYFAVKSPEVAEEFSRKYNESIPPN